LRKEYAEGDREGIEGTVPTAGAVRQRPLRAGRIYDALRREIVLGTLPQGSPLAELQLADRFDCSQSSVREALFRLQEDGLVWREGYRGSSVSRTSRAEAGELLALRLRLEPRALLRGLGADAGRLVNELAPIVQAMEDEARAEDLYGLAEADHAFHARLFATAGLRALEPILGRCLLLLHRFALSEPGRQRTALESAKRHWPIVEALGTGEAGRARLALVLHIQTVVQGSEHEEGMCA
jgi:GntR family transcriptional regulator, rspAB operon transcriptional repressor